MNDNEIQAKSKLKTFGEFWIGGVQFVLTTPATGQILTFTSATTVENTEDPTLNPYTSFTLDPETGAVKTYKSGVLIETLDLNSFYISATELTAILANYQTNAAAKNGWKIRLNSGGSTGDMATRKAGLIEGTDYPTGWTLAVGSAATNLIITHGLGRHTGNVNVSYTDDLDGNKIKELAGNLGCVNKWGAANLNSVELVSVTTIEKEVWLYIFLI